MLALRHIIRNLLHILRTIYRKDYVDLLHLGQGQDIVSSFKIESISLNTDDFRKKVNYMAPTAPDVNDYMEEFKYCFNYSD